MRFHIKRRHIIDFIFPIAVFFVFALSALTLILLAARIYHSTTENSSLQYTSRTGLAYISERIHQADDNGSIYLDSFDGCDALVMETAYGEDSWRTYIYAYGQSLKELSVKNNANALAKEGRTILEIHDFTMEQISDNLFRFNCTDSKNKTSSTVVGIRSR